jgi:hypothetical protein
MDGAVIRISVFVFAFLAFTTTRALAQEAVMPPLGDVARQAEAAKSSVKKAKKTYTNSDLSADTRGEAARPAAAASSGFESKTLGKAVAAEEIVARSDAKAEAAAIAQESEEAWRKRATAIRQQVDRIRSRLSELTTPNKLTEESPILKAAVTAELRNTRAALVSLRAQWARLEASARENKISMAWLEPAPQFPE